MRTWETIQFNVARHVATITLDRPRSLNSFDQQMLEEFGSVWEIIRADDDIHVVVLRASGDRAFSTGADVKKGLLKSSNIWNNVDPGQYLGPKQNRVWKPMVTAVHGMAAGGAFYWLNESDIIICSSDASFFDPHVTYGRTAAVEPIGLSRRVPLGEALRITLMGIDERVTARRAYEIGLVSEIVDRSELWSRAEAIAGCIASKPPVAIQGSVKAIWSTSGYPMFDAMKIGYSYTQIGNPTGVTSDATAPRKAGEWTAR